MLKLCQKKVINFFHSLFIKEHEINAMNWQVIHKLGQKNRKGTEVINKSECLVGENQETWLQPAWILEIDFYLVNVSPNM